MKNLLLISFILLTINCLTNAQNIDKAEKSALMCLDKKLAKAGISSSNLLADFKELEELALKSEMDKFMQKNNKMDSLLTLSGFYKNDHLDISILASCLESKYNFSKSSDTNSSFHTLLKFFKEIEANPQILHEISPQIIVEGLRSSILEEDTSKDFYKIFSFIMFQGINKEFINLMAKEELKDNNNEGEVLQIIDSDDEIYFEEVDLEISRKEVEEEPAEETVFIIVEQMPEYPDGGMSGFRKFLNSQAKDPVEGDEVTGKVYVSFVIDEEGNLINSKVVRGIDPAYDAEALRVIKSSPKWIPGEQGGEKVKVQLVFPVLL